MASSFRPPTLKAYQPAGMALICACSSISTSFRSEDMRQIETLSRKPAPQ
jgi:hypothetical protein